MGFFDKHEPVILKESSSAKAQLEALESLRGTLPANAEKQLEKEIRTLEAGIKGEQSILFELKNSHMDMYVLHDLFLEHNGLTAQIDFLVLTPQRFFVLESKQLYGDIRITEKGEFIRRRLPSCQDLPEVWGRVSHPNRNQGRAQGKAVLRMLELPALRLHYQY